MSEAGYVYVLYNPALKGLVKIGRTSRDPRQRAEELSSPTGLPTPFELVYDAYFADANAVEQFIHVHLTQKGFRRAANREFFEMPLSDAVKAVLAASAIFETADPVTAEDSSPDVTADLDDVCDFADALYEGEGDVLQDQERAIELYRKAATASNARALLSLAHIWLFDETTIQWTELRAGLERAIANGILEANGYFAVGMIRANHESNTRKCWDRLFDKFSSLTDRQRHRWGWYYAVFNPVGDVASHHREILRPYRDVIIRGITQHAPQWKTKAELVLCDEEKYGVAHGRIGAFEQDRILIFNAGDSIYGSIREVKLGVTLYKGQDVRFVADTFTSPRRALAIAPL
jgi:hypothetical protein